MNMIHTAYVWVNGLYLSDKQFGIQTAHCIAEMSLQNPQEVYNEWAKNNKTIIMFDGKNSGTLKKISKILNCLRNYHLVDGPAIPVAEFREDEESLNGALTSVGVIIPEDFRALKYDYSPSYPHTLDSFVTSISVNHHNLNSYEMYMREFATWMDAQRLV